MSDYKRLKPGPYQEKVTSFSWEVPDQYNIATLTRKSRRIELGKAEAERRMEAAPG